jgi:hypothetical protein
MNKHEERAIVKAFLRCQDYPASALMESDRERPDALIDIAGQIVGVEVTTLVEATPRQAIPPQKWTVKSDRIVPLAKKVYERRDSHPLIVRFGMRANWIPGAIPAAVLADELARLTYTSGRMAGQRQAQFPGNR